MATEGHKGREGHEGAEGVVGRYNFPLAHNTVWFGLVWFGLVWFGSHFNLGFLIGITAYPIQACPELGPVAVPACF